MAIKNVITTGAGYTPRTDPVLKQEIQKDFLQIKTSETKLLNLCKRKQITDGKLYTYASYTLGKPKDNAQLEVTGLDPSPSTEYKTFSNALQILKTDVMVSDTMQAAARTDGKTTMSAEIVIKKQEHDRDLEVALLKCVGDTTNMTTFRQGLLAPYTVAVDNTVAGRCASIFNLVAGGEPAFVNGKRGNIVAFDSKQDWTGTPTQLSTDHIDYMSRILNENGIIPNKMLIGADLKEAFNHEMARMFRNDKKLINNITSYENNYSGDIGVELYNFLSEPYGLSDVVIMGDFSFLELCYLINTTIKNVITDKTAISKRIFTQMTLALRNHKSIVIGVGLKGLPKKTAGNRP